MRRNRRHAIFRLHHAADIHSLARRERRISEQQTGDGIIDVRDRVALRAIQREWRDRAVADPADRRQFVAHVKIRSRRSSAGRRHVRQQSAQQEFIRGHDGDLGSVDRMRHRIERAGNIHNGVAVRGERSNLFARIKRRRIAGRHVPIAPERPLHRERSRAGNTNHAGAEIVDRNVRVGRVQQRHVERGIHGAGDIPAAVGGQRLAQIEFHAQSHKIVRIQRERLRQSHRDAVRSLIPWQRPINRGDRRRIVGRVDVPDYRSRNRHRRRRVCPHRHGVQIEQLMQPAQLREVDDLRRREHRHVCRSVEQRDGADRNRTGHDARQRSVRPNREHRRRLLPRAHRPARHRRPAAAARQYRERKKKK